MRRLAFLAVFALLAGPVSAQPIALDRLTPEFPNANAKKVADVASWVTALANVALDTRSSWDSDDRRRAFELQGVRIGLTYGVGLTVKHLVNRRRPCAPACGSDDNDGSFYSAHTALAFQAMGGPRLVVAVPLAVSTGGLRVAAGKHWLSDVIVGSVAGMLTSQIR